MSNLSHLKILILESNNLIKLTINSIKQNMPDVSYKVVKKQDLTNSRIGTALSRCKETTLVVESGLVLNIQKNDIPNVEKLNEYDICVSREGVFTDHKRLNEHYRYVAKDITDGVIDLSIFIINLKGGTKYQSQIKGYCTIKRKCLYQDICTIKMMYCLQKTRQPR